MAMVSLRQVVVLVVLLAPVACLSHSAHQCSHESHESGVDSSLLFPHASGHNFNALEQASTHHHHGHEFSHHIHEHHEQPPAHDDNIHVLPEERAEEVELAHHGFWSQGRTPNEQTYSFGVWLSALGCSLLVSTASLICLVLLPFIFSNERPSAAVVDALAGFGAGAMLGDAFLHQLPHAFGSKVHTHHEHVHSHHGSGRETSGAHGHTHSLHDLSLGMSVISGILLFFIVEKFVRFVEEKSARTGVSSTHGHHHLHHYKRPSPEQADNKFQDENGSGAKEDKDGCGGDSGEKGAHKEQVTAHPAPSGWVLAYLNLFSDGVHNFTDGMALGSAFLLHGSVGGWSRTLFLLAHELPQEVGDFGILVRSGLSVSKALAFNFLSALLAVAGTALALVLGGNSEHSSLVEGFTAGGFIYISVAGVLPGMHVQGSSPRTTLSQLASLSVGVGVAIAISLAE